MSPGWSRLYDRSGHAVAGVYALPPTGTVRGMSDKIIRFPGAAKAPAPAAPEATGPDGLTEDQRKAVQIAIGGMAFVIVGIKPTDRGADFFTAVHGDPTDLRNAQDHLGGVIARALSRKGIS